MKIRLHADSIRIRLSKVEVQHLGEGKHVEQVTPFSDKSWITGSVEPTHVPQPVVRFDGVRLAVMIPIEMASQWANSADVSISAEQKVDEHHSLQILIEKDFQCLHLSSPDGGAFPNPRAAIQ